MECFSLKNCLFRVVLSFSLSVGLGTILTYRSYKTYWHKTIYRVQTVDFNILSHTLPTTLSHLLVNGKSEEIQNVLNSNYGLFGLVVTNPNVTEVLYHSEYKFDPQWAKSIENPSELLSSNYQFSFLRDPVPDSPEWSYPNAYSTEEEIIRYESNIGKPIGRLYFIRNNPPEFSTDILGFLQKPWGESSRYQVYRPIYIVSFLLGAIAIIIVEIRLYKLRERDRQKEEIEEQFKKKEDFYKKRDQENEEEIKRRDITLEAKDNELQKRENQLLALEQKNIDLKSKFQQESEKLISEIEEKQHEIYLINSQKEEVIAQKENELELLKIKRLELEEQNVTLQEESLGKINKLSQQIEAKQDEISSIISEKNKLVEHNKKLIIDLEERRLSLESENIMLSKEIQQKEREISFIRSEKEDLIQEKEELINSQEKFKKDNEFFQQYVADLESSSNQELEQLRKKINEENERFYLTKIENLQSQMESLQLELDEKYRVNSRLFAEINFLEIQLASTSDSEREIESFIPNISDLSFALISGHQTQRNNLKNWLCKVHGIDVKNISEVPSSREKRINTNKIKSAIQDKDYIILFTEYTGHDSSGILGNLRTKNYFKGEQLIYSGTSEEYLKSQIKERILKYGKIKGSP